MDHLSDWLTRPRLGDDKPPSFWPSAASAVDKDGNVFGSCRRQQFLTYLKMLVNYSKGSDKRYEFWDYLIEDVEATLTPTSKYMHWIWEQGELFETHVLDLIKESGLFLGTQIQVYIPEFNVSGKIDAIAYNPYNQKKIICEVKSVYGYNADKVLGTDFDRKSGIAGEPRDKNLMQIALYQWHYGSKEDFDYAQLIYGDRGTGKYAVYQVDTKPDGSINWRPINPGLGKWTAAPYTIFEILNVYKKQQEDIDAGILPPKDFSLIYSAEELTKLVSESFKIIEVDNEDKELNTFDSVAEMLEKGAGVKSRKFTVKSKGKMTIDKATALQFVKYIDRETNGGRKIKKPEAGNFNCIYCNNKYFCFNQDGTERK